MIDGIIKKDLSNVVNYLYALIMSDQTELFNANLEKDARLECKALG